MGMITDNTPTEIWADADHMHHHFYAVCRWPNGDVAKVSMNFENEDDWRQILLLRGVGPATPFWRLVAEGIEAMARAMGKGK